MRTLQLVVLAGVLAVVAIGTGFLHDWRTGASTFVVAVLMLAGVYWAQRFPTFHAGGAERAWTVWLLLPSLGAIGAVLIARDEWPLWSVLALAVVALPTIAGHALFMGQRDKVEQTAPEGPLLAIVRTAPLISAIGVLAVLSVAGVVSSL